MNMMEMFGYILTFMIGLSLGLIGAGGSILTIPILLYLFNLNIKEAIPMSLIVVGISSLIASIYHGRQEAIKIKEALVFLLSSSFGAFIGGLFSKYIPNTIQIYSFIALMLFAGLAMLLGKNIQTDLIENTNKQHNLFLIIFSALLIGILTGIVGIGGGFMIVPALILLLKYSSKESVRTSLLIICINSLSGFLGNASHISLDWQFLLKIIFLSSLGSVAGSYLHQGLSAQNIQKIFAILILCVGSFMLIKEVFRNFY